MNTVVVVYTKSHLNRKATAAKLPCAAAAAETPKGRPTLSLAKPRYVPTEMKDRREALVAPLVAVADPMTVTPKAPKQNPDYGLPKRRIPKEQTASYWARRMGADI